MVIGLFLHISRMQQVTAQMAGFMEIWILTSKFYARKVVGHKHSGQTG